MTEAEWLACSDPRPLIGFLRHRLSHRKGRLFAAACCRLVSHLFSDDRSILAVAVAERYADGLASDDERAGAWAGIDEGTSLSDRLRDSSWWADSAAESAVMGSYPRGSWYKGAALVSREVVMAAPETLPAQLAIFRCIFGNPFHPVTPDPSWLTPTVVGLATAIYEERAFHNLPILADALEEAGCSDAGVLGHCRGGGEHVRGCWAVDMCLGKA